MRFAASAASSGSLRKARCAARMAERSLLTAALSLVPTDVMRIGKARGLMGGALPLLVHRDVGMGKSHGLSQRDAGRGPHAGHHAGLIRWGHDGGSSVERAGCFAHAAFHQRRNRGDGPIGIHARGNQIDRSAFGKPEAHHRHGTAQIGASCARFDHDFGGKRFTQIASLAAGRACRPCANGMIRGWRTSRIAVEAGAAALFRRRSRITS